MNCLTDHSKIRDFSPLSELPVKFVNVSITNLRDLSVFKKCPIQSLYIYGTPVTDLSPLRGISIRNIRLLGCAIRDFSPLTDLSIDHGRSPWVPYLTGQITVDEFSKELKRFSVHAGSFGYGWMKTKVPTALAAFTAMKLYSDGEYQASADELKKAYAGKVHETAHALRVLYGALKKEGVKFE